MLFARLSAFLPLTFGLVLACSTVPKETSKGRAVQVIKGRFTETCTQVGKIRYDGTPFIHDKELLIIMKENAAKLGGNAVRLDTFTPGVTGVSNAKGLATSYKCPVEKLKAYVQNPNAASSDEMNEEEDDFASDADLAPTKPKSKARGAKSTGGSKAPK